MYLSDIKVLKKKFIRINVLYTINIVILHFYTQRSIMEPIPFEENILKFQKDVDSYIFAATSAKAFKIPPKIHISTVSKIRPTENTKLTTALSKVIHKLINK